MQACCPICRNDADIDGNGFIKTCRCGICGPYHLRGNVMDELICIASIDFDQCKLRSALFYYLRVIKTNHLNKEATITLAINEYDDETYIDLRNIYSIYPKTFSERLEMVINILASLLTDVSDMVCIADEKSNIFFMPPKLNEEDNRKAIINLLKELGYIRVLASDQYISSITFSAKGWEKVESIQRMRNSKTVFIAMSFNFSNPIIEKTKQCIKKAIKQAGYIPRIISEKEHNNFIMDEIIYEIENALFVVADLTEQKTGVYYEAGYAKALRKEVIFTCHESDFDNRHFDIAQVNTLKWDNEDLFVAELVRRIEITVGINKIL